MRQIILFDIDHTLVDTHKLRQLMRQKIANLFSISEEKVLGVEEDYGRTLSSPYDFDPDKFIRFLHAQLKIEISQIEKAFYDENAYRNSLFAEIIPVLKDLSKHFILGVYSDAVLKNQMTKLEKSGIIKYFDKDYLFIFRRKREENLLKKLPKEAILIDDNLEVLEDVKNKTNLTCIWINRKDKKIHPKFVTIHSLSELKSKLC